MKLFKSILIIALTIFAININAQIYNIATNNGQTISTCSGTFYDSGGPTGGYVANETYTITFCPSTTGASINVDFTSWNLGAGDNLEIFDGPTISSPSFGVLSSNLSPVNMIISASVLNTSGCLTFKWTSTGTGAGWVANLSCGLPCQNFYVDILSSTPPFHIDSGFYYIDICPGDTVSITAQGNYGLNDSIYHQDDLTSTFMWDLGNYTTDTAQTVTTVYDTIKGYNVELSALDTLGCLASQTPKIRVRLSTRPDFDGTHQVLNEICQGDSTSLIGVATTKTWQANSSLSHAGTTYLPDGSGASYTSTLIFNVFAPGQTVQNVSDILSINATLEHSYLGDLNITVTCPNGQSATLKSYPGGSSTFLGEPIDNNSQQVAGLGYEYAWKSTGTTTMLNAVGTYNHTFTDVLGTTYSNHSYLPPSYAYPATSTALGPFPLVTYLPETPYSTFIGCPLNGSWTITVTDNLFIDNGFIFAWGIDFSQSVLPVSWSYQPVISSQAWNNASSIISTTGSNAVIMPSDSGQYNYTYTVVDDFGCTYDTTISVTVVPTPEVDLGNDTIICGFGIVNIDAGNNVPNSTYSWNTGNTNQIQQTNISGDYIATVSYSNGNIVCSNTDTMHVDQYDMADINLGEDTCVTEDLVLHAGNTGHNPPFVYLWSDGSTQESLTVTSPGTYSVTVAIDPNSPCIEEDEIVVTMFQPDFLGDDQEFCSFEDVGVVVPPDGTGMSHQYKWSMDGNILNTNDNFIAQKFIPVGDHIVKVEVDNGCTDEIKLTSKDCQLEIPNIITPNGDGANDKFKIEGLLDLSNSTLIIYNRWGKKVYESSNYQNDWDGDNLADGTYFYVLRTNEGVEKEYNGSLTIMRK